jgi:hypothetical protein
LRKKSGTPDEFRDALAEAILQGFITLDEAQAADRKYTKEWEDAISKAVEDGRKKR